MYAHPPSLRNFCSIHFLPTLPGSLYSYYIQGLFLYHFRMSPSPGGSVFLVTSCEPGLYLIWTALACFLRLRIMYLLSFVPSSTTLTDASSINLILYDILKES